MNSADISSAVKDVIYGIWLALSAIYNSFGIGMKIICTVILILFLAYILIDLVAGIFNACRRIFRIVSGEDPNG